MTLEILKEGIEVLLEIEEAEKKLEGALQIICSDAYGVDVLHKTFDRQLRFLETLFNDKETQWIEWFIYENDYGKKEMQVKFKDGTELNVKTVEDIYKVMMTE